MRSSQPPAGATWLLRQLGCGPRNEAILGDLIEQWGQGRSHLWYWRQCLIAIAIGTCGEVRQRKLRTFVAISVGWMIFAFYRYAFDRPQLSFSLQLNFNSYHFRIPPIGLITYWLHVVVESLAVAATSFVFGALSGRAVAKVQPSAHAAAVLMFTASLCGYWLFALVFSIAKSGLTGLGIVPGHEISDLLALPFSLLPWATAIVGILMGSGLLQSPAERGTP
jgi:hypothetical protein